MQVADVARPLCALQAYEYLDSLFPIRHWLGSYNFNWLTGDMISGITVCLVLVPQSMSYAAVAGLESQFGLYTSFVGVMIYALFATAKDVTIGPVAVMSLETHSVIQHVLQQTHEWRPEVIASALAFICGVVTLGIGVLRLGWIVDYIPSTAIAGFMTGSALTIAIGQVPKLMGISSVHTNSLPCYRVVIETLKHLGETKLDAAFGLPALFTLYFIRWFFKWLPTRYPRTARISFFCTILRNAFVIIVLLVAARIWLGNNHDKKKPISLLGHVPRGFKDMGKPNLDPRLLGKLGSKLPVSVIVLLLEHISIAKSFGRVNDYTVNASQELIAIGVTNVFSPFFGAYAATGSFSRSAIKAKSGVKTPVAGWITGIGVLIAIYGLTGVMQWIPNAALSAVIIHAVGDLITSPATLYRYWLISPLELVIWFASVMVTIFTSVDNGVYTSVAASAALLLVRIARPRGRWLGMVRVSHGDNKLTFTRSRSTLAGSGAWSYRSRRSSQGGGGGQYPDERVVFMPLDSKDALRDPSVRVEPPPPGVLVYRFEEAYLYPNASHLSDGLIERAKQLTRPGKPPNFASRGEQPWNRPGPMHPWLRRVTGRMTGHSKAAIEKQIAEENRTDRSDDPRPLLRAFVFDFSCVGNVDTTSIQALVDVRRAVELYADAPIEFHFANILSPWIRRALLAGGFGTGTARKHVVEIAPVVPNSTAIAVDDEAQRRADEDRRRKKGIARIMALRDRAFHRRTKTKTSNSVTPSGADTGLFNLDSEQYSDEYIKSSAAQRKQDDLEADLSWDRQQGLAATDADADADADAIEAAGPRNPVTAAAAAGGVKAGVDDVDDDGDDQGEVQVPIVWDNDLTPLFHLDLASAVEAAAAADPEDALPPTEDAQGDLVFAVGEGTEHITRPAAHADADVAPVPGSDNVPPNPKA